MVQIKTTGVTTGDVRDLNFVGSTGMEITVTEADGTVTISFASTGAAGPAGSTGPTGPTGPTGS